MYNVFVDKPTTFECEVQVKNATLKNSIVRLILESNNVNLIFNGKIENNRCVIPIKRLKGILDENTIGTAKLEVIVEDTYFSPWKDNFDVTEHTSVKVKMNEQKSSLSNKPSVKVKSPIITNSNITKKSTDEITVPKKEISIICETFGIRKKNLHQKKKELIQILKEYFRINPEYNNHKKTILSEIYTLLR